jgi:hypothetical protein
MLLFYTTSEVYTNFGMVSAKQLGTENAVLCICHMDKAYMKGFHRIRYERTTAVSEGAECCDYRLRYDPGKE